MSTADRPSLYFRPGRPADDQAFRALAEAPRRDIIRMGEIGRKRMDGIGRRQLCCRPAHRRLHLRNARGHLPDRDQEGRQPRQLLVLFRFPEEI